MITAEKLDEIRARALAATKGPWWGVPFTTNPGDNLEALQICEGEDTNVVARIELGLGRDRGIKNSFFIEHARLDIPILVAAYDELREFAQAAADDHACKIYMVGGGELPCQICMRLVKLGFLKEPKENSS